MDMAQNLLKLQHPSLNGLGSTLTVEATAFSGWVAQYLQILHCRGNHWICMSTLGCKRGEIHVFDSNTDETTKRIRKIFGDSVVILQPHVQKQKGVQECGLIAIAFTAYLSEIVLNT